VGMYIAISSPPTSVSQNTKAKSVLYSSTLAFREGANSGEITPIASNPTTVRLVETSDFQALGHIEAQVSYLSSLGINQKISSRCSKPLPKEIISSPWHTYSCTY
jgi:hypothetical protein